MAENNLNQVALIAELVRRAPTPPGRTALMKLTYFLKTLKSVPLSYDFGLYTYGPFDSDVLDDLKYAEALRAVEGDVILYVSGGKGYQYRPGSHIDEVTSCAKAFLSQYSESIDWVLDNFGSKSAQDLEMASTLVFIDRATLEGGLKQEVAELARKVRAVKPYLSTEAIDHEAREFKKKGLLLAVD